jgi:hypothetical protein
MSSLNCITNLKVNIFITLAEGNMEHETDVDESFMLGLLYKDDYVKQR